MSSNSPGRPRRVRHPRTSGVAAVCRVRRGQRGVAVVELALMAPLLALVVFSAIDLGRLAQYQNRLSSAAREGAAIAQTFPGSVSAGCRGDRNVVDRVRLQEPEVTALPGFALGVSTPGGTPYTGCDATGTLAADDLPGPGERVRITVSAEVRMSGPLTSAYMGHTVRISRSIEVVVQG